jgi:ribosome modulation factor
MPTLKYNQMNIIKLIQVQSEGEFAYRVGVPHEECPYDKGSEYHDWWLFGWVMEREAHETLEILCKIHHIISKEME